MPSPAADYRLFRVNMRRGLKEGEEEDFENSVRSEEKSHEAAFFVNFP